MVPSNVINLIVTFSILLTNRNVSVSASLSSSLSSSSSSSSSPSPLLPLSSQLLFENLLKSLQNSPKHSTKISPKVLSKITSITSYNLSSPLFNLITTQPHGAQYYYESERIEQLKQLYNEVESFVNVTLPNHRYGIDSYVFGVFNRLTNLVSVSEFFNNVKEGLASSTVCLTCRILALIYTSDAISTYSTLFAVKSLCIVMKIQKSYICRGMIDQISEVFDYVRFNTRLSASDMCAVSIGLSCASSVGEKVNWTIPLSKKSESMPKLAATKSSKLYMIAQLTDVHMDPFYVPGTVANCEEPVCCRPDQGIAKRIVEMAGLWGNYKGCDTPFETVQQTLEQLNKSSDKLEYIISTGDVTPHDVWNYRRATTLSLLDVLDAYYSSLLSIPVYSVIGNHEAIPVNSFSPSIKEIEREDLANDWLYNSLAHRWSSWLPKEYEEDFRNGGNYVVKVHPGFRIIGLNTNYCARMNPWILYESVDPGDTLTFLARELAQAESEGDTVHLVGHIAPDHRECTQAWLHNFIRILTRFQSTVRAQFYGHNHRDEFRIYYSLENPEIPVGFAFICPSLTSYSQTNPSYRIYQMNEAGDILDYQTYYFNLTKNSFEKEIDWKVMYQASQLFEADIVNHETLDKFLRKIENDNQLFDHYHRIYYCMSDADIAQYWDEDKKRKIIADHKVKLPLQTAPFPMGDY